MIKIFNLALNKIIRLNGYPFVPPFNVSPDDGISGLVCQPGNFLEALIGLVLALFGVLFRYPENTLFLWQGQLLLQVKAALADGRRSRGPVDDLVDKAGPVNGAFVDLQRLNVIGERLFIAPRAVVQNAPVGVGGGVNRNTRYVVGVQVGLEIFNHIAEFGFRIRVAFGLQKHQGPAHQRAAMVGRDRKRSVETLQGLVVFLVP